jgi:hypothetical protein
MPLTLPPSERARGSPSLPLPRARGFPALTARPTPRLPFLFSLSRRHRRRSGRTRFWASAARSPRRRRPSPRRCVRLLFAPRVARSRAHYPALARAHGKHGSVVYAESERDGRGHRLTRARAFRRRPSLLSPSSSPPPPHTILSRRRRSARSSRPARRSSSPCGRWRRPRPSPAPVRIRPGGVVSRAAPVLCPPLTSPLPPIPSRPPSAVARKRGGGAAIPMKAAAAAAPAAAEPALPAGWAAAVHPESGKTYYYVRVKTDKSLQDL